MYFTTADGALFDSDPIAAAAIRGTIAATDAVRDVNMPRLWSNEDVIAIRMK